MITSRLTDVAEINPRFQGNSALSGNTYVSFVPMASVSEISGSIEKEENRLFSELQSGLTYFRNNDILVAKITPCFENGKIAFARINNEHGFGSTEFHVIR